ncbi:MAG: hypothetical protein E7354_04155 [Clostridiales bacterium]|nr:hypothetical protein [Clostridiales bacterium]
MFEKDKATEMYTREKYTFEESLYAKYVDMRKIVSKIENFKYSNKDTQIDSEDFKQGFIAGVKIMSSLFMDM